MPTFFGDDDIPQMLETFGVPIVVAGAEGIGIVDYVDEMMLQAMGIGGVIGRSIMVTVQTSAFPGVETGNAIQIEGIPYEIRHRLSQSDGAVTQLFCQVPAA